MDTLDVSAAAREYPDGFVLARRRKFAAVLAIVFPPACLLFLVAVFIKNGFDLTSLFEHSFFVIYLGPGLVGLLWAIKRYFKPAVRALSDPRPIYLQHGQLVIQGRSFPVEPHMIVRADQSVAEVVANGRVLGRFPAYFMRLNLRDPRASA